jgi:glucose-6-phosphate isomerase
MELEIGGRIFKSETRFALDLKPVLAYPDELHENFPAYEMFRNIYFSKADRDKILENSVRYDLTFTTHGKIGKEYIKTYGHYHPEVEKGLTYPELYEILEGKAYFVLQKPGKSSEEIEDVIIVEAKEGDKIIVPPNYGHVMINPTDKNLKSCNWVYSKFSSIYNPYTKMRGAAYYLTEDGWIRNERYRSPKPRFSKPKIPKELGLRRDEEIYKLIKTPEKLEFLYRPSLYQRLFEEAFEFE